MTWRGLRLGRRMVRLWRWISRERCKRYIRLNPDPLPSPSRRPCNPVSISKKFFVWGRRCLTRGKNVSTDRSANWDGGSVPLLEEDDGGGSRPRPPKGHLVVYVGDWKEGGAAEPRRYVVPLVYFQHPLFGELLREAEEMFGYRHPGGITIPCPVARFERVRTRIAAAGGSPTGRKTAHRWKGSIRAPHL